MTEQEILHIFKDTGVMLEGHFLLTSGRHSAQYMQCAQLFQYPKHSHELCAELAGRFDGIDLVIGPAMGGIIMAYEVSSALNARNIFTERVDGAMALRRGFEIKKGENILICEDVVTTGGSVKEVIEIAKCAGGIVRGVCAIVDRSGGNADFGCAFEAAIRLDIETFEAGKCPLCEHTQPVKPGSRK